MKIHYAGCLYFEKRIPTLTGTIINNRLASYVLTAKPLFEMYRDKLRSADSCMIVDSGAFSVWVRGDTIATQDYIQFCLDNHDIFDYIVNLDVIPGKPRQRLSQDMIRMAASGGWNNFKEMINTFPKEKVIHVFHQGEDFKWLDRIANSAPYIGLSPANDKTTKQRTAWLDNCMKHVLDEKGYPKVKFHGFAATSSRLMTRYPWYSVDSASWIRCSAYGNIYIPVLNRGVPDYTKTQAVIALSDRTLYKKNHFRNQTIKTQHMIRDWVSSLGFCIDDLGQNNLPRFSFNARFFQLVEQSRPEWPWAMNGRRNTLF